MSALYPIAKRTNNIFFNAILGTLESAGCTNIVHNGKTIRCTYQGKGKRLIYSSIVLPGHVTTCVHALQHLGLIKPDPTRPSEQKSDPNIRKLQLEHDGVLSHAA